MLTIEITQEHIDRGVPRSVFQCPMSLALQQHFPFPVVSQRTFSWRTPDNGFAQLDFPKEATEFLVAIDRGQAVKPLSFELDLAKLFLSQPFNPKT